MYTQRWQLLRQAPRRAGILALQRSYQLTQTSLGVLRIARLIECRPVGALDPFVQRRSVGQFGDDVSESMNGTPLAVSLGPQLVDAFDKTRRPASDNQPRPAEPTPAEAAPQVQPVLVALALPDPSRNKHPLTQA